MAADWFHTSLNEIVSSSRHLSSSQVMNGSSPRRATVWRVAASKPGKSDHGFHHEGGFQSSASIRLKSASSGARLPLPSERLDLRVVSGEAKPAFNRRIHLRNCRSNEKKLSGELVG